MIDENAFGVLLGYFDIEEDEYGLDDRAEFVERFRTFRDTCLALVGSRLPPERRTLCLGHAVYTEFHDSEEFPELFVAVRQLSAALGEAGFDNITVLAHGSRWVDSSTGQPPAIGQEASENGEVVHLSAPSEPLRRALNAESFARPDDELGGWGAGVYVDTEALEALGKQPKNAPTALRASGATFYRVPPLAAAGPTP